MRADLVKAHSARGEVLELHRSERAPQRLVQRGGHGRGGLLPRQVHERGPAQRGRLV